MESMEKSVKSKREINPEGINTGNLLERTACPVHESALKYLYMDNNNKPMSLADIVQYIQSRFKMTFCIDTISVWLKLIGVELRKRGHAQSIADKQKNYTAKARAQLSITPITDKQTESRSKIGKVSIKKAKKQQLIMHAKNRIIINCQWYECKRTRSVIPAVIKAGKGKFCGRSCARKYQHHETKLQRLAASIQPTNTMTREQALAQLGITDIPKHL